MEPIKPRTRTQGTANESCAHIKAARGIATDGNAGREDLRGPFVAARDRIRLKA